MNIKESAMVLLVILALPIVWYFAPRQHGVKVYDCSLAEFHPDFTTEIREACRKARMKQT
jgi:hypothetical protein